MDVAAEGADSVFRFIERTAEEVSNGFRWRTIDYNNKPQYHYDILNGCGGISLFLAEYFRQTGSAKALELAIGANQWCSSDEHSGYSRGLLTGKTGVAMAWLHLSLIVQEPEYLDHCTENAEILRNEDPGPVTDLIGGEASNGLFLIRLWQATDDKKYLEGAIRCGAWLREQMVRDRLGCYCLVHVHGNFQQPSTGSGSEDLPPFSGVAHGIAGVAHFLILLYEATADEDWASLAREILETLLSHAVPDKGGLNWGRILGAELDRCQWSHGSPGIGLVFLKAKKVLGDPDYYEIALKCGETTYAYGDQRRNATQCIAVAGNGELLIELYRASEEERWLHRAHEFAVLALRIEKNFLLEMLGQPMNRGSSHPITCMELLGPDITSLGYAHRARSACHLCSVIGPVLQYAIPGLRTAALAAWVTPLDIACLWQVHR